MPEDFSSESINQKGKSHTAVSATQAISYHINLAKYKIQSDLLDQVYSTYFSQYTTTLDIY